MKELKDGTSVPPRCWYYLLNYNDRDNWWTIHDLYGVDSLHKLLKWQFWELFHIATTSDIEDNKD